MGTMPGSTYKRSKFNNSVLFALLAKLEKAQQRTGNVDGEDAEDEDIPGLNVVPWDNGESLARLGAACC